MHTPCCASPATLARGKLTDAEISILADYEIQQQATRLLLSRAPAQQTLTAVTLSGGRWANAIRVIDPRAVLDSGTG